MIERLKIKKTLLIKLFFILEFVLIFSILSCYATELRYENQPNLPIPFAFEKEDLDTFLKLDEDAMKILVQEGRVILLEPGTKYTLIESGFFSLASKVMITSGLLKGQKGFVPSSARDVMGELTGTLR